MMKVSTSKYLNQALGYAKRGAELKPESADAMYIYAQVLIYSNDYHKARDYYHKAIELKPSLKDPLVEQALTKNGL
jgi:tetratricopeptide (TPR) repeat protein